MRASRGFRRSLAGMPQAEPSDYEPEHNAQSEGEQKLSGGIQADVCEVQFASLQRGLIVLGDLLERIIERVSPRHDLLLNKPVSGRTPSRRHRLRHRLQLAPVFRQLEPQRPRGRFIELA